MTTCNQESQQSQVQNKKKVKNSTKAITNMTSINWHNVLWSQRFQNVNHSYKRDIVSFSCPLSVEKIS
jgi:hypothetical protein